MQNLTYEIGDNVGGLERIFYVPVEDLDTIPLPASSNIITENILLKTGKKWYYAEFSLDSMGFSCDGSPNKNGVLYKNKLQALASKSNPSLTAWVSDLDNRHFVLLVKANNGEYTLVGDQENYLTFKSGLDTGTAFNNRNQVAVTWSGESTHPAWFYEGTFEVYDLGTVQQSPAFYFLGLEGDYVLDILL